MTLPRLGSRVRIPSPAPNKAPKNQHQDHLLGDGVAASIGLNEPRTVPSRLAGLGKRRAKRSRKVLAGQKRNVAPGATERRAHSNGKASHIETTEGARRSEA